MAGVASGFFSEVGGGLDADDRRDVRQAHLARQAAVGGDPLDLAEHGDLPFVDVNWSSKSGQSANSLSKNSWNERYWVRPRDFDRVSSMFTRRSGCAVSAGPR